MELDIVLFILRMLSTGILLTVLGLLFFIIWKDYQAHAQHRQSPARNYGRLVMLLQVDGHYQETKTTYPLRPLTTIGRSPTSIIVIDDTFASSEHAVIVLRDGQWWLEDRNSRNGTLLNKEPVTDPTIVTDGDIIGIGNVSFRLGLD